MDSNDKNTSLNITTFIKDIGDILLLKYGKKQFYFPQEVTTAHSESAWREDEELANLARATFCTFSNFENYHQQTNDSLDYGEIRDAVFLILSKTLSVHEIEKYGFPIETGNYPKDRREDLDHLSDVLLHISLLFD